MIESQPTTDPAPHNPLRLWDRTIRKRARDVARRQIFRLPEGRGVSIVLGHSVEHGVEVLHENGQQEYLAPSTWIEIPYGPAPIEIPVDGPQEAR